MEETALALAIANSGVGDDRLASPGGLRAWLEANTSGAAALGDGVLLRLGDFRALREAVALGLRRAVDREAIPPAAVGALNTASAMAPAWPVLRADGVAGASVAIETADASETTRILATIARSAIELLGGPRAAELRICPACGRFFLASRRRRVWCSAACGNRTRVARHRERRAGATPP